MIFASNNKGKIKEIKRIFSTEEILSLKEVNVNVDVIEDADSFYGNALKKAKEIYEITKIPVIADDSGICIEAFEGGPGVLTRRFAGEEASDEERNQIMVDKLSKQENKRAQVICILVYYDGTNVIVGEGILSGNIVSPRGTNGFGFDPIFELDSGKTLAEISTEEKNTSSARYLAALDLKKKLAKGKLRNLSKML
jgi:XTP/dITP diphosphohydrolase